MVSVHPKIYSYHENSPIIHHSGQRRERYHCHALRSLAIEVSALGSYDFEVIFIDDGTWAEMQSLSVLYPKNLRALRLRSKLGKARALNLGFRESRGDLVFTLDADLQDDPKEIGRFLAKRQEGYDIVTGFKQKRQDPWPKVLPSRVFNRMLSQVNGVPLHDHNCGFKCYGRAVLERVRLHGEMHRMVPSIASIHDFRTAEIGGPVDAVGVSLGVVGIAIT